MPLPTPDWNLSIARNSALGFFTTNTLLLNEQVGYEYDSRKFKLGDGVTPWNLLPYATATHESTIWLGLSTDADQLLETSPTDHGFILKDSALNNLVVFDQALAGTITDLTNYTTVNTRKASIVKAGILLRKIIQAMGSTYSDLLNSGTPATNITAAMQALQDQITTLSNGALGIDDVGAVDNTHTWSNNHITSKIAEAVAGLVGSAPSALNTLEELSNALGNNANLATSIATELGNCIKYTVQSLNTAQQIQARANLGITDAFGGVVYTARIANYTAVHKDGVLGNTSAGSFTVTLPATPFTGTQVYIVDASDWSLNPLTVTGNGSTIENGADDINLDVKGISVSFIYNGTTWKMYAQNNSVTSTYVASLNGLGGPLLLKTVGGKSLIGNGDIAGGLTPTPVKAANYGAASGDLVRLNSTVSGFTVTLPAAPADGDLVGIFDIVNQCATHPVVLVPSGGKTIEGDGLGFDINISGTFLLLMYIASTNNWKIQLTPTQGGTIVPVTAGGTGSATAAGALTNLGAMALSGLPVVLIAPIAQLAVANTHYVITNVAATVVTMPATPVEGDMVVITVDNGLITNTINFNGKNHEQSTDATMTIDNARITITWRFLNNKWRII